MPANNLSALLTDNDLAGFFKQWPTTIHPSSPLNKTFRSLRADWNAALEEFIKGNTEDDGSKSIRELAFALVDRITPADLEPAQSENATPDPPVTGYTDPLKALIAEKLAYLRKARVLSIDPSVQFTLDQQIKDLERQLKAD